MIKYTVPVKGMMCGGCEAHVNDAVRKNLDIREVSSSHAKNHTIIVAENELDEAKIREVIEGQGHEVGEITKEPYEKKRFFSFLKKK